MSNNSPILTNLHSRSTYDAHNSQSRQNDRFMFCIREMPALALKVAEELRKKGNVISGKQHVAIEYRGVIRAGWRLGNNWPSSALPKDVKEYGVYYLDSRDIVSKTTYWSGREVVGNYDPFLYVLPAMSPQTVYAALADLPGDFYFEQTQMKLIPT